MLEGHNLRVLGAPPIFTPHGARMSSNEVIRKVLPISTLDETLLWFRHGGQCSAYIGIIRRIRRLRFPYPLVTGFDGISRARMSRTSISGTILIKPGSPLRDTITSEKLSIRIFPLLRTPLLPPVSGISRFRIGRWLVMSSPLDSCLTLFVCLVTRAVRTLRPLSNTSRFSIHR